MCAAVPSFTNSGIGSHNWPLGDDEKGNYLWPMNNITCDKSPKTRGARAWERGVESVRTRTMSPGRARICSFLVWPVCKEIAKEIEHSWGRQKL